MGRRALNYFGSDRIYCFVDNYKAGQTLWGKQVLSFDELLRIHHSYEVLLSVHAGISRVLEDQCDKGGIPCKMHADMISHEDYESDPDIRQFENKHKGERCFLIGNGPSLRISDLNRLHEHDEISFGCNSIFMAFDQTEWRPLYYCLTGYADIESKNILANMDVEFKFFGDPDEVCPEDPSGLRGALEQGRGNVYYIRGISLSRPEDRPRFSPDASKALYGGGTVMYKMMQMAVYMGFTKIYLLGVDGNSTTTDTTPDEYVARKLHFYEDDTETIARVIASAVSLPQKASDSMLANAYAQAEQYTRERDIKILNTTRGGIIEAFECVDFDTLFGEAAQRNFHRRNHGSNV